jgi:hypothetical protein
MLPLAIALACSLSQHVFPVIDEKLVMWTYLAVSIVGYLCLLFSSLATAAATPTD